MSAIVFPLMRAVELIESVANKTTPTTPYEVRMIGQMREDRRYLVEFAQEHCSHPSSYRITFEGNEFDQCDLCLSKRVQK